LQGPKEARVQSHLPGGANVHNFNRIHQVARTYPMTLCYELCKNSWMDRFTVLLLPLLLLLQLLLLQTATA